MVLFDTKELQGYTFVDLFAGIGGFRLALESLGAKCVFSSEIDTRSAATYRLNFGELPAGDIRLIHTKEIPKHDILCAGFPCQPFSASGYKLGFSDTRGTLFFDVARIVKERTPKVVLMENVQNFSFHDGGKTLAVVETTLNELGYSFYHKVLNAVDYGIPQHRKRTYMVGFREDLHIENFEFPHPRPLFNNVRSLLLNDDEEINKLYRNIDGIYPPNCRTRRASNDFQLVGFYNKAGQGERIYNPDGVCITLSTSSHAKFQFPKGVRRLHQRECARLMGFPDSFVLPTSFTEAHRQLGNAVVVDVIQYIAKDIGLVLRGEDRAFSLC